jgi:hypothetical protein
MQKQKISQLMAKKYIDYQYQLPKYNPLADFDWIQSQSGLPWLPLSLLIPHESILTEIKNIEKLLSVHRDEYGEHFGWKSFCIHGKAYNATRELEYYKDDRPYNWTTEAQTLMPATVDYFKTQWPGDQYQRVRVMLLEPGGYVSIHRDHTTPGLTAINIAITQPVDCNFIMEKKGTVPFVPGTAFWVDISNNHTVFNNSNQNRWHIIVHQNVKNQKFQEEVVKSYNIMYNNYNENRHNHNQR